MGKLTLDDSKTPATPKIPLELHFHSITYKVRNCFCCIEMRAVVSSQVWSPSGKCVPCLLGDKSNLVDPVTKCVECVHIFKYIHFFI